MERYLNPIDPDELALNIQSAVGFPHFCIDNFLKEDFAEALEASFPPFSEAVSLGKSFNAHHEYQKVQINNVEKFPEPVKQLNDLFGDEEFINFLSKATGIDDLLYDKNLGGGGMHMTNGGGRLDVHVDFNLIKEQEWYRRLNILLYFNKDWKEEYGGYLDLWDKDVKNRIGYFDPRFNRLCGFVTSEISFHGVTPVTCPTDRVRKSFATYYYTEAKASNIADEYHSTIFVPRPNEKARHLFLKPVSDMKLGINRQVKRIVNKIMK